MTGQEETVRYFQDDNENCLTASLSDDGKEILLWASEGGQSEMQATVYLDGVKAIELASYLLSLSRKIENASNKCCVCGIPATERHMSIVGQIPFFVCDQHHKETCPAMGWDEKVNMNRMGLMWIGTNEWVYKNKEDANLPTK